MKRTYLIGLATIALQAYLSANDTLYDKNTEPASQEDFSPSVANEETFLKQQKDILSSQKESFQSIYALKELCSKSLVITADSLEALKLDPETAYLKLDMYEGANLPTLISEALSYVLSRADPVFNELLDKIKNNQKLESNISNLLNYLKELKKYDHANFDDEAYLATFQKITNTFIILNSLMSSDNQLNEHYFCDFLKISQKFVSLAFVRYNTEKMLNLTRTYLDGIQGVTSNSSGSLSINIPLPISGASATIDAFASSNSYGSTGLSFYTVTSTKGVKAGLTFSVLVAKISAKGGAEKAAAELFYSLEAYMDYLNSLPPVSLNKAPAAIQGMTEALSDRKTMQEREREALACNGMFERYLRLFHAIPNTGVSLQWVDVTKATATDKTAETALSAELLASAAIPLSSLGITLKGSKGVKKYSKDLPMMSMVNDDFTIADGHQIEELKELIGKNFDLSETIGDSNFLLGRLNEYIFALERMAFTTSKSEKEAYRNKKHSCEKQLAPKKIIGSYGRNGVLKACMLTAAILRKKLPDNKVQALRFKKIHEQLHKLSLLSEFSRNETGFRKFFGFGKKTDIPLEAKADVSNLSATFTTAIPMVGNVNVSLTRKTVKGSPFLQENGKYITLKFSLPVGSAGVVGMRILREKFNSVLTRAKTKKSSIVMEDFLDMRKFFWASGANVGVNIAGKALAAAGSPLGASFYASSDFTFVWKYVPPLEDTLSPKPLPTQSKIVENKKGRWVLDFVVVATAFNGGINTTSIIPVSLKLNASLGKLSKRTGPNTFHDLFSKFNALSLGKADSQSNVTTAIDSLLAGQSGQILKIFKNVGGMKENAAFELQTLYNDLQQSITNESDKKKCKTLFEDFTKACVAISKNTPEDTNPTDSGESEVNQLTNADSETSNQEELKRAQFKNAFDLFREIAELQYTYSFKPYYNDTFK
ncbi:MAG: hypothetical protein LBT70_04050 [Holosporaceae bacterium]|jgi:hypothetical protein|nr:hypothetical protein [Holosporaceae bacterium]